MAQTQQQIAQFSQKDAQVIYAKQSPQRASLSMEQKGCSRVELYLLWHNPCCPPSVLSQAYPEYEVFMGRLVSALVPLLDVPPVDTATLRQGSLVQWLRALRALQPLLQAGTFGISGSPDNNGCLPTSGVDNAEFPFPRAQAAQEPQLG